MELEARLLALLREGLVLAKRGTTYHLTPQQKRRARLIWPLVMEPHPEGGVALYNIAHRPIGGRKDAPMLPDHAILRAAFSVSPGPGEATDIDNTPSASGENDFRKLFTSAKALREYAEQLAIFVAALEGDPETINRLMNSPATMMEAGDATNPLD